MVSPLEAGVSLGQELLLGVEEENLFVLVVKFPSEFRISSLLLVKPLLNSCHHHLGIVGQEVSGLAKLLYLGLSCPHLAPQGIHLRVSC